MKIISRSQLQDGIDSLAEASLNLIKKSPEIPYTTFKNQVEMEAKFYLQQQQIAKERIALEKAKLLFKLKNVFRENIFKLNKLLTIYSDTIRITSLDCKMRVTIIGAGPAGLITAYLLARQGAEVTIFEARNLIDFSLRPQHISIKEAEIYLKGVLERKLYQKFFQRGAALDHEGKLRITIGTFQEVLVEGLKHLNVKIHYNTVVTLHNIEKFKDADFILIAAGAHAYNRLTLQDYFEQEVFDHYTTRGRTALFIRSSLASSGYIGHHRDGYDWWRKNTNICSGNILSQDIDRVIAILSRNKTGNIQIKQLKKLKSHKNVEYTFIFGNNSSNFLKTLDMNFEPILQSEYIVTPTILCNPLSEYQNKSLIVIGDSNGTPHPLAAIGTLKFIKDAKELMKLIAVYKELKNLHDIKVISENIMRDLLNDAKNFYALTAMENIKKVFYENILSALFCNNV